MIECQCHLRMPRFLPQVVLGIVLAVTAIEARAQLGVDLPPGTHRDDVVRAYGWPKGRSVLGAREIWMFDGFQVTLENGQVVDVARIRGTGARTAPHGNSQLPFGALPQKPREAPRKAPLPPIAPSPLPPPASVLPMPRSPQVLPPVVRQPPPFTPVQIRDVPPRKAEPVPSPFTPVQVRDVPPRKAVPLKSPFSLWRYIVYFSLAGLFLFGLWAWIRGKLTRRNRAVNRPAGDRNPEVAPPPTSFEQQVAERLRGLSTPPPPVPIGPWWDVSNAVPSALSSTGSAPVLDAELIRALEWKRFELLVTRYLAATGVQAALTGPGADGGVDVVLTRPGEGRPFGYVQCKAWGSELIGVSLIRELFGVMAADKIREGLFVTTSDFTPEAKAFAAANGVVLIATADLVLRLGQLSEPVRRGIVAEVTAGDYTTPSCPACERKMVWREKPAFWGCPKYPSCRSSPIYPRGKGA